MINHSILLGGFCCLAFAYPSFTQHHRHNLPHQRAAKAHQLIENANSGKISFESAQKKCGHMLEIVSLSGKVFHFAPNIVPPDAPVAGVLVSIAEFPFSRYFNIRSDENGEWSMPIIKFKHIPLMISLRFEKEGFVTTKSQVFTLDTSDIDSIAMQYPGVEYFQAAVALLEDQVSQAIGMPYTVQNLTVTTVGKSWASMFFNQFPHGDQGATVTIDPPIAFPSLGPIYFNESVSPDPSIPYTSIDGGVLYANLPEGEVTLYASKDPFTYTPVTFDIEPGVNLYIASPPHANQGTNNSGPGEW
jgi:hypothetical protein